VAVGNGFSEREWFCGLSCSSWLLVRLEIFDGLLTEQNTKDQAELKQPA
jgi:hypothetical protein